MKTIGKLIIIGLLTALLGFIFKMTLIPGGGIILVLSLSFLSILAFIQFFLSFLKIQNNNTLKVMSALMSFTLLISFIGILFRYQWWPNSWHILNFSGFLFVMLTIFFIKNYKSFLIDEHKNYVLKNLLIPWIFIFIFGGLHYLLNYETFYNTFNSHKERLTYQEFLSAKDTLNLENEKK